jgi:hypothetical protein
MARSAIGGNEKAPPCGAFAKPSDGLEQSTTYHAEAVANGGNRQQPIASS